MNNEIELFDNAEGLKIPIYTKSNRKIRLHSLHNCEYESELIYENKYNLNINYYLFIGFGFGHHITKFAQNESLK